MKYKAIMLDIDGTVIPYQYDAKPSKRVIDAIVRAKEKVHICLVTGRSYYSTKRILKPLGLTEGYAVIDTGSFVIDINNDKVIHKQTIETLDVAHVIEVFEKNKITFYVKNEESLSRNDDYFTPPYQKGDELGNVSMVYTYEDFTLDQTHIIMSELARPHLNIYRTRHRNPEKYGLNITHVNATKLHGIEIIAEKLSLKREEIIGVGDGYNDFPLLMASGLKVAMGNALPDLKAIADYVEPSADEDGVADVIEKFILS
jgi:hypothetical protein